MNFRVKKILAGVLMAAFCLLSGYAPAQERVQDDRGSTAHTELPDETPGLEDIIPLTVELVVRLETLKGHMNERLDGSAVEKEYERLQATIGDYVAQLQRLKNSNEYTRTKLVEIREAVEHEHESFEDISKPIRRAIRQLATFREEWLSEQKRWHEWQNVLINERGLVPLSSVFEKAQNTIDTALNFVLPELDVMLNLQEKGGTLDAKLKILANELEGLIVEERRGALLNEFPPMFSSRFLYQLRSSELWESLREGLGGSLWQSSRFFVLRGWIVLIQGLVSLFVIISTYRNRALLKESTRWGFLAERPVSAGLFLGYITTALIYDYQGAPAFYRQALSMLGGLCFARLVGALMKISWKRQFVYGLMIVLIVNTLMEMLSLPLPVLRLFTFLTALIALVFCWRWAKERDSRQDSRLYPLALRVGALFFALIMIMELWGQEPMPSYLLISLMRSMAAILLFLLSMHMIRGGVEWLFHAYHLRHTIDLSRKTDALVRRVAPLFELAIWGLVLIPAILVIWGAFKNVEEATQGVLNLGFTFGTQRIRVSSVLIAAAVVYGSFLLSWMLQNLLMDRMLLKRGVERGVQVSIKRLVHYVLISLGFLLAISMLGFEITKLTIMLSALGVGIGFGLQDVVNNFVSGLILLFERPVRVGDYIELGGNWCEIKKIGLRSTAVQTFDQADVIIPNADLVTNQVTNWTLSNRRTRLIIPVGVAYGSDVPVVIETLKACADGCSTVVESPAPQVLFLRFGESTLDFELRVWILDVDQKLMIQSELHQEIDRKFRDAKIEIAFPQRDVHLHSGDESVILRKPETTS